MLAGAYPAKLVGSTKAPSWVHLKEMAGDVQTPPPWVSSPDFENPVFRPLRNGCSSGGNLPAIATPTAGFLFVPRLDSWQGDNNPQPISWRGWPAWDAY